MDNILYGCTRREFLLLLFNREFNSNFLEQTTVYSVLPRYIVAKVLTCHIAREYVAIACRDTLPSMTLLKIQ